MHCGGCSATRLLVNPVIAIAANSIITITRRTVSVGAVVLDENVAWGLRVILALRYEDMPLQASIGLKPRALGRSNQPWNFCIASWVSNSSICDEIEKTKEGIHDCVTNKNNVCHY